jgi:hypothetical protein
MVYEDSASVAVWSLIARDGMTSLRARSDVDETMTAGKEISTK